MLTENPVLQAIRQRRSIRRYTDEAVSDEAVRLILEAGIWAPSGLNNQPCRFLVIRADDPRCDILAAHTRYGHIVRGAKVIILVFLDREAMYNEVKDHQAAGAAVQNMLLAAHALQLGAVWLGEIINQAATLLPALALDPARLSFEAAIAAGHPAQNGSSSRRPLAELLLEEPFPQPE
ncbi:nitroreductase [Oleidesulfovibrio alaskensis G20]|uniref:Nitroreductase n=2 Tax=Oleidesulfovibrio alaskensis (strain ATCC BAA-1058 / DSM 17464 / G20) TaxID=207559 RepID=Q314Q8_OLEA2|nr:nitroreductase family protein [Oleidesulfovibrio alaskensis]ABB37588.1 nitroreductase [Oleidesulfovibrio alaskensis G20]MBG0774756.1 nitroreductase family protein [Oleidesulfovibrio alaskensis]